MCHTINREMIFILISHFGVSTSSSPTFSIPFHDPSWSGRHIVEYRGSSCVTQEFLGLSQSHKGWGRWANKHSCFASFHNLYFYFMTFDLSLDHKRNFQISQCNDPDGCNSHELDDFPGRCSHSSDMYSTTRASASIWLPSMITTLQHQLNMSYRDLWMCFEHLILCVRYQSFSFSMICQRQSFASVWLSFVWKWDGLLEKHRLRFSMNGRIYMMQDWCSIIGYQGWMKIILMFGMRGRGSPPLMQYIFKRKGNWAIKLLNVGFPPQLHTYPFFPCLQYARVKPLTFFYHHLIPYKYSSFMLL